MHLFFTKKLAASVAFGIALAASYPASLNATTVTVIPTPPAVGAAAAGETAKSQAKLEIQEAQAMDIWLAKLAHQESRGQDHLKILDVNGLYSYGCLQFQEGTFRTYALKYGYISRATP